MVDSAKRGADRLLRVAVRVVADLIATTAWGGYFLGAIGVRQHIADFLRDKLGVVALGLASLGLQASSPQAIALPFKVLLFVAVDGWRLLFESLLRGYV